MSWTPNFWITEEDFKKVRDDLFDLKDEYSVQFWKFRIFFTDGVVISGGETTQAHRDVHDIIQYYSHWILNGEGECCIRGEEWGDEIDENTHL